MAGTAARDDTYFIRNGDGNILENAGVVGLGYEIRVGLDISLYHLVHDFGWVIDYFLHKTLLIVLGEMIAVRGFSSVRLLALIRPRQIPISARRQRPSWRVPVR